MRTLESLLGDDFDITDHDIYGQFIDVLKNYVTKRGNFRISRRPEKEEVVRAADSCFERTDRDGAMFALQKGLKILTITNWDEKSSGLNPSYPVVTWKDGRKYGSFGMYNDADYGVHGRDFDLICSPANGSMSSSYAVHYILPKNYDLVSEMIKIVKP